MSFRRKTKEKNSETFRDWAPPNSPSPSCSFAVRQVGTETRGISER